MIMCRMASDGRSEAFMYWHERSSGSMHGSERVFGNERQVGRQVFPVRFVLFKYVKEVICKNLSHTMVLKKKIELSTTLFRPPRDDRQHCIFSFPNATNTCFFIVIYTYFTIKTISFRTQTILKSFFDFSVIMQ